ncbi:MAG TPA: methyl-accepting chemotaxis protein, partial [Stenomitos sp.]
MLGVGGYSLLQVKGISGMLSKMYASEVIGVSIIKDANIHLISRGRAEKNAILASDPAEIETQIAAAEEAAAKLNASLDQYEPLISTEKGRGLFKEIRHLWGQFEPIQATIFREARRNDDGAAIANAASGRAIVNQMDEKLAEIAALKEGVAKRNSDLAQADATAAFWVILGFLATATLAGTGIGLLLAHQISQGALKMAAAAEGISQGDLEQHVALKSHDELGDMARSFQRMIDYLREMADSAHEVSKGNLSISVRPRSSRDTLGNALSQMVGNLRDIVQRVRTASETVGAGAQQIASSSTELAKTVSVQASSAEETSAAMEEMAANIQSVDKSAQDLGTKVTLVRTQSEELAAAVTQTSSSISELAASVQQVAGNVGHASRRAEEAAQAANAGDRAVMQTTAGMSAIAETMNGIRQTIQVLDQRSGEIGAIIEVIDDIAEQTNLLALNAAIEAARAGDAGRGFAVVADEVRKLAERSAKATGEIGSLIKGIQQETAQAVGVTTEGATKVQEGVELADHTSQALARIKEAADHVTSLLSEV